MATVPLRPTPPPQQWPCGPDCVYAQSRPGTYGEWMWCERPHAATRAAPTGHECVEFRAPAYPGERAQPAKFSASA